MSIRAVGTLLPRRGKADPASTNRASWLGKKEKINEFEYKDNRSVLTQIKLMQVEMRIHLDIKFRVGFKEPLTS